MSIFLIACNLNKSSENNSSFDMYLYRADLINYRSIAKKSGNKLRVILNLYQEGYSILEFDAESDFSIELKKLFVQMDNSKDNSDFSIKYTYNKLICILDSNEVLFFNSLIDSIQTFHKSDTSDYKTIKDVFSKRIIIEVVNNNKYARYQIIKFSDKRDSVLFNIVTDKIHKYNNLMNSSRKDHIKYGRYYGFN